MKRLILQRHAKTEPWYEGVDDHGRALTERGHADAVRVAEALKRIGWIPDFALVSSARRARETWLNAKTILSEVPSETRETLYLAGASEIESLISEHSNHEVLLAIGHNPGFHDLARQILGVAGSLTHQAALQLTEKFPTGCAALFEAEEDMVFYPASFKLVKVIRPKELRSEV